MERAVMAGAKAMEDIVETGAAVKSKRKADNSLVMNLDIASQSAILSTLGNNLPVVSEEAPESHKLIHSGTTFLLVDPLDGTSTCRRCLENHGKFVTGNVGFGPLVGAVKDGVLVAATFLNLPDQLLYTAERGKGAYFRKRGELASAKQRLSVAADVSLRESAILFYSGKKGEMPLATYLRTQDIVDSVYRFGGFASDCTRLARGYEQGEIQFSLRPWDLSAALIAEEAGLSVVMDPLGTQTKLKDWRLRDTNPALLIAPGLEKELLKACESYKRQ